LFIEDIWDITDDRRLTLGARYDRYSDFGSAFSPRAGITWEYMKGYEALELRGSVYNLLDKEYSIAHGPELPNDWPMPDRNYLLELRYTF